MMSVIIKNAAVPTLCEGLTLLAVVPLPILPLAVVPLPVVVLSVLRQLPSCSVDTGTVSRCSWARDATWNVQRGCTDAKTTGEALTDNRTSMHTGRAGCIELCYSKVLAHSPWQDCRLHRDLSVVVRRWKLGSTQPADQLAACTHAASVCNMC